MFHVSHLRKYVHNPETTIPPTRQEDLIVEPNLTFFRQPFQVVVRDDKRLRNKTVKLVKVQWSDNEKDCTWETEDRIRDAYPDLLWGYVLYLFYIDLLVGRTY